jgi:hypothetical protein
VKLIGVSTVAGSDPSWSGSYGGSLTTGSSLKGAIVSSAMKRTSRAEFLDAFACDLKQSLR